MIKPPKDYPHEVKSVDVNGKEAVILGVEHVPEFYDKHADFLEQTIKNAGAVVIEISSEDLENKLYLQKPKVFFNNLFNITANYNKELYKADPINLELLVTESDIERKLYSFYMEEKGVIDAPFPVISVILEKGVPYNVSFDAKTLLKAQKLTQEISEDYREACIAGQLEKILKIQSKKDNHLLAIHGASHTDGIAYYLENPEERKLTLEAYHEKEIKADETLKKFSFINKEWKKVFEKEY